MIVFQAKELKIIQREMVLAHKRNEWDTVRYLAKHARRLRKAEGN